MHQLRKKNSYTDLLLAGFGRISTFSINLFLEAVPWFHCWEGPAFERNKQKGSLIASLPG